MGTRLYGCPCSRRRPGRRSCTDRDATPCREGRHGVAWVVCLSCPALPGRGMAGERGGYFVFVSGVTEHYYVRHTLVMFVGCGVECCICFVEGVFVLVWGWRNGKDGRKVGGDMHLVVHTFPSSSDLTQIAGTRAEPQQIVAQRLLSCLQYPVPFKSSTKDLTRPTYKIILTV